MVSQWRNGILILVSNRLGLKQIQNEYLSAVKAFFMSNFNCGIIGGKPKEAFYLVGVQEDSLIFLDPHATQSTIGLDERSLRMNHNNFHEGSAKKMPFNKLDPTLTFAFYLRTADEFE